MIVFGKVKIMEGIINLTNFSSFDIMDPIKKGTDVRVHEVCQNIMPTFIVILSILNYVFLLSYIYLIPMIKDEDERVYFGSILRVVMIASNIGMIAIMFLLH